MDLWLRQHEASVGTDLTQVVDPKGQTGRWQILQVAGTYILHTFWCGILRMVTILIEFSMNAAVTEGQEPWTWDFPSPRFP